MLEKFSVRHQPGEQGFITIWALKSVWTPHTSEFNYNTQLLLIVHSVRHH